MRRSFTGSPSAGTRQRRQSGFFAPLRDLQPAAPRLYHDFPINFPLQGFRIRPSAASFTSPYAIHRNRASNRPSSRCPASRKTRGSIKLTRRSAIQRRADPELHVRLTFTIGCVTIPSRIITAVLIMSTISLRACLHSPSSAIILTHRRNRNLTSRENRSPACSKSDGNAPMSASLHRTQTYGRSSAGGNPTKASPGKSMRRQIQFPTSDHPRTSVALREPVSPPA